MKFVRFLKLISKKIEKYDRLVHTNPFENPLRHYTIVWVEDKLDDYPLRHSN